MLAGLTTLLSLWRYLYQVVGLPFPEGVLDNSPAFAYIETAPDDVERFRGIASEPAGLASSCLVTIAYMLPRSLQVRGWRRAGALLVAAAAAYLGVISTSATFVVAGVAIALIAGLAYGAGFLLRRTHVSAIASVVGCALVIAAIWILPIVADFVETTVNDKVSSTSYAYRSSDNATSLGIFLDTFGFGVGLGANRASSFVPEPAQHHRSHRNAAVRGGSDHADPAKRACSRVPARRLGAGQPARGKVIAGPDLSDTTGVLWISLGLLSHAALISDRDDSTESPAWWRARRHPRPVPAELVKASEQ